MKDIDVSIIIPTYNRKALVREAIESCLRCGDVSVEVIVVDDGSTDGTDEVFAQDSRVRYVRISHGGAPRARNYGLHMACGRAVWFLDSDDLLISESLSFSCDAMSRSKSDAVITPYILNSRSLWLKDICLQAQENSPNDLFSVLIAAHGRDTISGNSVLYSRSYIERYAIRWDEGLRFSQDSFFLLSYAIRLPQVAVSLHPSFVYRNSKKWSHITDAARNTSVIQWADMLYPRYRSFETIAEQSGALHFAGRRFFASHYHSFAKYAAHDSQRYSFFLREALRVCPDYRPSLSFLWNILGARQTDLLLKRVRRSLQVR